MFTILRNIFDCLVRSSVDAVYSIRGETCSLFGWMCCRVNGLLGPDAPHVPRKMSRSGLSSVPWCGVQRLAAHAWPALLCDFPFSHAAFIRFLCQCYCMCLIRGSGATLLRPHPGVIHGALEILGFGDVAGSPAKPSGSGVLWGGFYENFLSLLSRFVC